MVRDLVLACGGCEPAGLFHRLFQCVPLPAGRVVRLPAVGRRLGERPPGRLLAVVAGEHDSPAGHESDGEECGDGDADGLPWDRAAHPDVGEGVGVRSVVHRWFGFRRFRQGRDVHGGRLGVGDLFERGEVVVGVVQGLPHGLRFRLLATVGVRGLPPGVLFRLGRGRCRIGGETLLRCEGHGFPSVGGSDGVGRFRLGPVLRRQRSGRYGDAAAAAHGFGRFRRGTGRVEALLLRGAPPVNESGPRVWMFGD